MCGTNPNNCPFLSHNFAEHVEGSMMGKVSTSFILWKNILGTTTYLTEVEYSVTRHVKQ